MGVNKIVAAVIVVIVAVAGISAVALLTNNASDNSDETTPTPTVSLTPTPTSTVTSSPTVTSAPTTTSTSTASPTPAQTETAAWPRTITDAAGHKVTLEKKPERIAILHSTYLEYFFALGAPPIASAGASVGTAMVAINTWETLKPYVGTADIIDLGSARELNLEAILNADPDVIVTFTAHAGLADIYDQLVQIAPVVLLDYSSSWQEQTRDCAEIVGKEAYAQQFIGETEAIISSAKETLSAHSDQTLAIFRTGGGKAFITRGDAGYYGTFGITSPENWPATLGTTMSLESLAEMNPDYIIFQDTIATSQAFVKSQEQFSIWNQLNAVKNGNVFYFDDSLNSFGPLALQLTAEKLLEVYS